jgi:hypothetical protein
VSGSPVAAGIGASDTDDVNGYDNYDHDHRYRLSFNLGSAPTTVLQFIGNAVGQRDEEGFGIDNIKMTGTAVPEPGSPGLMIVGMGAIGVSRRRRHAMRIRFA